MGIGTFLDVRYPSKNHPPNLHLPWIFPIGQSVKQKRKARPLGKILARFCLIKASFTAPGMVAWRSFLCY